MNDTESRPNRLDELAHDFAERLRRGEHPSLSEYAARHPELADEIRDLFPALAMIERFGSVSGPLAGGQASAATADGTPLQRLGEYRILREVARGGMGIVYEAVQESLGRHVALKVLPFQSLADATQRERFRREARAAANLHHTNIVPVYGIGEHDGIQYFAMQFIQGQTLDSVLREIVRMRTSRNGDSNGLAGASPAPNAGLAEGLLTGRFSGAQHGETDGVPPAPTAGTTTRDNTIGESTSEVIADHSGLSARRGGAYFRSVIRVGIQVAEALAYAHQNGIVHRDIKPANLLLDSRGTVWITDFGLAKSVGADDLTSPGDFMGTLRYMAPEQFRGAVGPSVDVYSLGLTLYELATLQPAFTANGRAEMYNQLLHKDPRQPRKIDPRIPQDLETLILKAIAKEPQHRYTSAAALAEDLRRILADRPIQARRSRWPERFVRWCRRNPAVATLTAVAAMLLVAIAAVALSDAARLRIEQAATQTHLAQAQRAESEATHRLYRSLVAQARAVRLSRRLGQRFKALEILTEATAAARLMDLSPDDVLELRNESIAALALPDLRIDKAWEIPRDYFMTLEFDPSFQRYACVDMQGVVRIHRVSDASEIVHFTGFDSTDHRLGMTAPMTFSPDGQFLVLSHNGRLRTWRLTEQEPVAVLDVRTDAGAFTVSPDSRQLVIGRANGAIDIFDLHSGQNVRHLEGGPTARDIAIHPSGGRLAVSCSTGVQIHDIKTNDLVATFPLPNGGGQIEWNPDGQTLAVCDDDNEVIHIWDAAAQITVVRLEGHRGRIRFAYSTAGDQIASYCWDGVLRLWDAKSGRLQLSTLMSMSCLRFSPDDRRLAASFDGTQLQVWDVATATAYRTLVRTPVRAGRQYRTCAIGPKDGLLALAMSDGVGFWNLATGASLGFAALGEQRFISIEPSGDLLISTSGNLQRVPLRREPAMTTAIQVGPPEKVPLPAESGHFAIDRTGSVLATAEYWGALVSRQDRPGPPIRLAPHEDTRSVAVSPDGRQVATGSFWRDKVKLWDSQTGTLERVLPVPSGSSVCYSPDGRWLATTGGGCRLWSVGTWEPGPNLGVAGPVAFSSDGSLFAMDTGAGVIKLFDPASGRECARLEDPSLDRSTDVAFSPDGGQLISTTNDSCAIHIWNLKAIREKLAQRQLDWNPSP